MDDPEMNKKGSLGSATNDSDPLKDCLVEYPSLPDYPQLSTVYEPTTTDQVLHEPIVL